MGKNPRVGRYVKRNSRNKLVTSLLESGNDLPSALTSLHSTIPLPSTAPGKAKTHFTDELSGNTIRLDHDERPLGSLSVLASDSLGVEEDRGGNCISSVLLYSGH